MLLCRLLDFLLAALRGWCISFYFLNGGLISLDLLAHFPLGRIIVEAAEHLFEFRHVNRGFNV